MIKVGSKVNVFWEYVPALFNVIVMYEPQQVGDVWIFKDSNGMEHKVQSFCRIEEVQ